jgi:hypothetical protein
LLTIHTHPPQCHLIHAKLLKSWKRQRGASNSANTSANVHATIHHHSAQLTARRSSATNTSTPQLDTEHNA